MTFDLLRELMELTEEEQAILQQKQEVQKELYTSQSNFISEGDTFLNKEKMIMVRKHKHDYIEMNYVYNGTLRQKVGGTAITLKCCYMRC